MASKRRSNWKAFSRSITPTRFIGVLVLGLSLPLSVYLVQTFNSKSSQAATICDLNGDGRVNTTDRDIFNQAYALRNNVPPSYIADLNKDRFVNATDQSLFDTCYNQSQPSPTPPIRVITPTPLPNLIYNGGFEVDYNNDGLPDSWTSNASVTRSSTLKYKDTYSMLYSPTKDTDYKIKQKITQFIYPGRDYQFMGFINIPASTDTNFQFKVNVDWLDSSNNQIRSDTVKTFTGKTNAWESFYKNMTGPTNAVAVEIRMTATSLNTKVYVDDFVFRQTN